MTRKIMYRKRIQWDLILSTLYFMIYWLIKLEAEFRAFVLWDFIVSLVTGVLEVFYGG